MKYRIFFIGLAIIIIVGISASARYFFVRPPMPQPQNATENQTKPQTKLIDFSKLHPEFLFSGQIPASFQAEYLPNTRAIHIYDPSIEGESGKKSKLYISFFKANTFLTLSTVTITRKDPLNIQEHPAILYEITKKDSVPNFAGQPSWRNDKHLALDIRANQKNPSYFYSFAYNPLLPEKIFNDIINSLHFY